MSVRRIRSILAMGLAAVMLVMSGAALCEAAPEIHVEMEEVFSDDFKQSAIVHARDANGSELWSYETEQYESTELPRVSDIGVFGDVYYLVEGGEVVALDINSGAVLWRNGDFGGASTVGIFDDEGTLFLCGFYGPDIFAVSADGATLGRIEQASSDYYWPMSLRLEGEEVLIGMSGTPEGDAGNQPIEVSVALADLWASVPKATAAPEAAAAP